MQMKIALSILCSLIVSAPLTAQENPKESPQLDMADQIKKERDSQLEILNEQLKLNEDAVVKLKDELSGLQKADVNGRLLKLEELTAAQDNRLVLLENTRKTSVALNGQLAFTELLSLQRDIKPAELFLASQSFFTALGNISNLQRYSDFKEWKSMYDVWYQKKKGSNSMLEYINNSVRLISDASNKIPLYGSIVNTVSSGIMSLINSVGGDNKKLMEKTPNMLALLNAVSQFESQKALIDDEWAAINEELENLRNENSALVQEQLTFYDLDRLEYEAKYLKATMDRDRDDYKGRSTQAIKSKLGELDASPKTKDNWTRQVEIYMYRVQSIRLRFGQLTTRMLSNIRRYRELIVIFSDPAKFPGTTPEFTREVADLGKALNVVESKFLDSFNPTKYIEDSAVMYIQGS